MRKTVLMLINGFGVEKNDSAEVYNAKLMPNFDALIKKYLFGNLTTTAGDYNNAYRLFSIPQRAKGQEDEIDYLIFEKKLDQNPVLQDAINSVGAENNFHIFYFLEGAEKFSQFREFLRTFNANKDKKVFVHLLMTATSTSAYEGIKKVISKISFEMSDYGKIGYVVGRNKINDDEMLRAFYRELGEHWNESDKKFDILQKEVVNPEDASVFIITGGCQLKENDTIIFMNYGDEVEMERFYNDFTKMPTKLFSLYPFKDGIPHMFDREAVGNGSFAATCEKFDIKILHMTTQERVNDVNFYLNGMEKKKSPNITYAINDPTLFATKEAVIDLVSNHEYDGIIIDFSLAGYNRMEQIKKDLQNIDGIIKNISDAAREKDYTFIVSSLYGIHVPVMDGVVQKIINFSGKVPILYQSNLFNRNEYTLNSGSTYALQQTFLTNINDEVKENKLVHKLGGLEKMLTKGK